MTWPAARLEFRASASDDRMTAGAMWAGRAETPGDIAVRLRGLVDSLGRLGGGFSAGFTIDDRPADPENLAELVAAAINRTDDGTPYPRFGYSFRLRGSGDGDMVPRLRITAGAHDSAVNRVVAGFDAMTPEVDAEDIRREFERCVPGLLEALIDAWQPDHAHIGTVDQMVSTGRPLQDPPGVLALTWFSHRYDVPSPLEGAEVVDWLGGTLVGIGSVTAPDLRSEAAAAVADELRAAGVLTQQRPEPPAWLAKPGR